MRLAPSGQPQRSCLQVVRPTRPPQRPYRTAPRSSPGRAPTARPTTWRLPSPPRASISRRPVTVSSGQSAFAPAASLNPAGEAVVAWQQSDGARSRIYAALGSGGSFDSPVAVSPAGAHAFDVRPRSRATVPPSSSGASRTARLKRPFAGRAQALRHLRRSPGSIRPSNRRSPLSAPEPGSRHGGDGMATGSASRPPCWRPARPASVPRRLSHPRTGTPSLQRSRATPQASRQWLGG